MLVSVVIPTYNRRSYLAEALASVLAQSRAADEIIVVDDGSTDDTAEMIRDRFPTVRYVWQANAGASAARNRGIGMAQGQFLAFLDSDDLWTPEKLSLQLAAFATDPGLEIVFGHVQQFVSPDLPPEVAAGIWCPAQPVPGYVPGAMLITRTAFDRVGEFEIQWQVGEVMSWIIRAFELKLRTTMLSECVYRRRVHTANKGLTHQHLINQRLAILKASLDRRRRAESTPQLSS